MATNLAIKKATPYSLAYEMFGDNGAADPAVNVVPNCVPGPLKALLTKLQAAGKLDSLNLDGANSGKVRIRNAEGIAGGQTGPGTRELVWQPTLLSIQAAAASTSLIEIRFEHSTER